MFQRQFSLILSLIAFCAAGCFVTPVEARPGTPNNVQVWNCPGPGATVCVRWTNRAKGLQFVGKREEVGFDIELRQNNQQIPTDKIVFECRPQQNPMGVPCFNIRVRTYTVLEPSNPDHPVNQVFFSFRGDYDTNYCFRVRARRNSDNMVSAQWSANTCVKSASRPTPQVPPGGEANIDRPGGDIGSYPEELPIACQKNCVNNPGCKAWTFVRPGVQGPGGKCYYKNIVPKAVSSNCCISGVK